MKTIEDCTSVHWDAVIVGTGMAGATLGYELARRGHKILFVEKGRFAHGRYPASPPHIMRAVVSADSKPPSSNPTPAGPEGFWPDKVEFRTDQGPLNFALPIGCITGGSTAHYAGALERFWPDDFTPKKNFPDVPDCSLPDRWPITYQELEPYYSKAETLYEVTGTTDPLYPGRATKLASPPELNERDAELFRSLEASGLNPYRLHAAFRFSEGCTGCPGSPCKLDCKRDAAWTCLVPALVQHNAQLLEECEVLRLIATRNDVTAIQCVQGNRTFEISAKVFVLAAGAFMTPQLLLRSATSEWPKGLGNNHDQVGRNLMFHGGDFVAISPKKILPADGPQKTLAMNDFYFSGGIKLGTFQTLGAGLEIGRIMQYLRDSAASSNSWRRWLFSPHPLWWRKLTSPFIRIAALVFFYLLKFKDAAIWVSIVEDLPYAHNRIILHPSRPGAALVEYHYSKELVERVRVMRKKIRQVMRNQRLMFLTATNKIDWPHVSGTCRFGDNPETSVLDKTNRVHGVRNLYVVDSSFFPSSAGTNPSLTIAANALRVADIIDDRLSTRTA